MSDAPVDLIPDVHGLLSGKAARLLIEAELRPVQGHRFQPTGFPDLGAATYTLANGTEMLLVESPQSVANRLESVCWDEASQNLVSVLRGLPYVRVHRGDAFLTSSILEFHRLNSPYVLEADNWAFLRRLVADLFPDDNTLAKLCEVGDAGLQDRLKDHFAASSGPVNTRGLARTVFKYDPNCLLHGLFLARNYLVGGRLRLPRLLSGFIEAVDVRPAESGGVKLDRVDPSGDTKLGFGNVPFHRTEFTAARMTAYFNLDLATLRGYGLDDRANALLVGLALWKVERFLDGGLRLRTACDLQSLGVQVTHPGDFTVPSDLDAVLPALIAACGDSFAAPPVTEVRWNGTTKAKKAKAQAATAQDDDESEEEGDE